MAFLSWAECWYRDLLIYAVTGEANELVNLDMLDAIERRSAEYGAERALAAFAEAAGAAAGIQRNLNRRMVLEKFLFGVVGSR